MTSERREEIEGQAIRTYGEQPQVDMAIEEMSELTKALLKHRRNEDMSVNRRLNNILEEIADVQIMLDQMRLLYGGTENMEEYKLNRLWARMEANK